MMDPYQGHGPRHGDSREGHRPAQRNSAPAAALGYESHQGGGLGHQDVDWTLDGSYAYGQRAPAGARPPVEEEEKQAGAADAAAMAAAEDCYNAGYAEAQQELQNQQMQQQAPSQPLSVAGEVHFLP